jgi:hypothetical protein
MPLERSPPRTGLDVPDDQLVGVLPNAFLLQRRDPKRRFFSASQLLNIERCDNRLNPPGGECPRICVGMTESEGHVFNNLKEINRASEWS